MVQKFLLTFAPCMINHSCIMADLVEAAQRSALTNYNYIASANPQGPKFGRSGV